MSVLFLLIFSLLFFIQCGLVFASIFFTKKYKLFYGYNCFCSLLCFLFRGLFLIQSDEKTASVFASIFLISEIFFYFSVLFFSMIFTERKLLLKKFLILFFVLTCADSVLMLSNIHTGRVFALKSGYQFLGQNTFLIISEPLYYIHFAFSLFFVLINLGIVLRRWKSLINAERKRFRTLFLFAFLFVVFFVYEFVSKKYGFFSPVLAFLSSLLGCICVLSFPGNFNAKIIGMERTEKPETFVSGKIGFNSQSISSDMAAISSSSSLNP